MNVNYMCQDLFGAAEQYAYNIPILLYPELEPEQGPYDILHGVIEHLLQDKPL